MREYHLAWWNAENLYDVMPWDERARKVKNIGGLKNKLKSWDDAALEKKLGQLMAIIGEMNNSTGPDILGVCEIENESVLLKLVDKLKTGSLSNRGYDVVHHDSPDPRGIDIAFIYDKDLFEPHAKDPTASAGSEDRRHWFTHEIVKRYPTRDIFQVNFHPKGKPNRPFILVGNHWPARMGGVYETEPYRIIAAETLSYFNLRIQQEYGKNIPILVMGDFNDIPGSRSMTDYALSTRSKNLVTNARKPRLLNLMWPLMDQGYGTFWYDGPLFFDQFLISKGYLVKKRTFSIVEGSVEVIHPEKMWEKPPPKGEYPQPRAFDWKPRNPLGYSDHFPIALKMKDEDSS
ncbi:MAG: endonuclease/exonuclease/phosphatase [Candidatus Bathyarchaeota archaeon]|nr:MAG: endonuclease/exonuclease/phosphatase [Candidatus Bathyarchaeota archaeon]